MLFTHLAKTAHFFSLMDWFCSETPRKLWKRCWPENVHIVERQTYEGLKISINSIIEATQFLLWHQVKYVLTERFCQDALANWFGRQKSLRSRKDNLSMVDFRYGNNAIRNQKHFKPITNVNSSMIALTDEPLPCWKPKKEWKFKCKSWIKKPINCYFSQNVTKHTS